MRRSLWLCLPLALGCAGALRLGTSDSGEVLEAQGSSELSVGEEAASAAARAQAQRRAVESLVDLYLPSPPAPLLERVLSRATSYVEKVEVLETRREGGGLRLRLLALVSFPRLGRDLREWGVLKPEGVRGQPRVLLALGGEGGALASEALRRALLERGYAAALGGQGAVQGAEALAAAERMGAGVAVSGEAWALRVEDSRLEGFESFRARLALEAVLLPERQTLGSWTQEATAVDISSEGASAKALANAGELAADRLRPLLAGRFEERLEIGLLVAALGGLSEARRLLAFLRGLPGVVAASLDSVSGRDVRLRVFVERISVEELAARMLKGGPYRLSVRAVEPEERSLEFERDEG